MTPKKLWNRNYILFLLSIVFAAFTDSTLISILPVHMLDMGGSNTTTGFMLTSLTAASLVTRLICGPLADRFGRKRMVTIGCAAYALNAVAYCFARDLPTLFFLRFMNGITQGIYFPVPPTLVSDLVPREKHIDGQGYFGIASSLSFAIAPSISLKVYENFGSTALYVFISIFAIISLILTLQVKVSPQSFTSVTETETKKASSMGIRTIFEFSIIGLGIITLLNTLGSSSLTNFIIPFGLSRGIQGIALFTLISNGVGIVTRLVTGRLARMVNRDILITASLLVKASSALIIASAHSLTPVVIAAVLLGAGNAVCGQLMSVAVIEAAPEGRRGVTMATFELFNDLGSGIGSPLSGGISENLGYSAAYVFSAVSLALGGAANLLRKVFSNRKTSKA